MNFILSRIENGLRIKTGFDSIQLAMRAETRAIAAGATEVAILIG